MREYDLNKIFSSVESYTKTKDSIKQELNEDYEHRKEVITLKIGANKPLEMNLGRLFVNLLLMRAFAHYRVIPKKSDLLMAPNITQAEIENYFDYILERLKEDPDRKLDYDEVRQVIADTEDEMCDLASMYNVKVGNSLSFRDFVRLECEDPEAEKLFNPTIKPGSFHSIETQFNNEGKKLFNYFTEKKDAELHPFVSCGEGVNKKQLVQMVGFVGLKPDMDGTVIPVVIPDNFLNGLKSVESYYINAKGTKKALITNKKMTSRSGWSLIR